MTYPLNTFNSDQGTLERTGLARFASELTLLAGFGALVFIVLALLSYSPQDAAWSTSGVATGVLHNRAGRAGAWIADVAYALMGYSAWWCVAAAAFAWALGLVSWMRGSVRGRMGSWWTFGIGMALLLLTSCGLEWTRLHRWDGALPGDAGGVLGHVSGRLAVQWLGYTGSTLLELAALACALALVFRFSWGRVAERVGALVYEVVTGQRLHERLRDLWAGVRAARARAKELKRERVAVEKAAAALTPLTPLAPQAGEADAHVDGGRVEPVFEMQRSAEAPAPAAASVAMRSAAWSEAVRPERVQLPTFLQGVQPAPQEVARLPQSIGRQAQRRGWLGALAPFVPALGKKAAQPLTERIEPQMFGQQSSVRDERVEAPLPAIQQPVEQPVTQEQEAAHEGAQSVALEQRIARRAAAAQQPSPVVQAARAALAARASRRMELLAKHESETAEERAWAAAAAAYAPEAERRRAEALALRGGEACTWADVDTSEFDFASADDNEQDFSGYEDAQTSSFEAGDSAGFGAEFVVSNLNPVRQSMMSEEGSAFDADEGAEDSLPPLPQVALRAATEEPKEFLGPVPLPQFDLLDPAVSQGEAVTPETLEMTSRLIEKKLKDFGVSVKVVEASPGPVITRYEIEPAPGVKGSRIVNLAKDLARSLSLVSIRVIETIPGKNCMALELPNARRQTIRLTEVLDSDVYRSAKSLLTVGLGKDIVGRPVVADLAKMPHVLVAGTTGSGKSVGINAMILSLLYKADPKDVRLMLIDPKMLEMSIYEGIPHLLCPVVTDMRQAANGLNWCVEEMERRYRLMSRMGVRNVAGFNAKILEADARGESIPNPFSLTPEAPEPLDELPSIVVIVDELADLMMTAGKKIEELIARLAQKARAAGIHLVLATQRPSTDVLTGLIKANVPTRMSFKVASMTDSRIILDRPGAETLLGNGDMLYQPSGSIPQRVHGAFVSDDEVHRVVNFLREHSVPNYIDGVLEGGTVDGEGSALDDDECGGEQDSRYDLAVDVVLKTRRASISSVQRHLKVGYNRAARLLEDMERAGVVSAMNERGQREILVPARDEG